jgi:polyferredoxin
MMGDAASSAIVYFAALYMLAGTLITAYLWKEGAMTRNATAGLAVLAVLFGFVLGALIMPAEFFGIANIVTGSQTVTIGIAAVCTVLALTLIVGRTFCGHVCPVGSIQELAYRIPVRKTPVRSTYPFELVRLLVFVSALVASLYAIDIVGFSGSYDFFTLTISTWSAVFAGLLVIAAFFYRPVCRAICPFGLLFSVAAHFSRYRLRRTDACISCRKCEKACPVNASSRGASKRECYLCARCTCICPAEGALHYSAD